MKAPSEVASLGRTNPRNPSRLAGQGEGQQSGWRLAKEWLVVGRERLEVRLQKGGNLRAEGSSTKSVLGMVQDTTAVVPHIPTSVPEFKDKHQDPPTRGFSRPNGLEVETLRRQP